MKKGLALIIFTAFFAGTGISVHAQSPGVQLANHIANKMKDTLGLTSQNRNQVFAINMYLHNRKMIVRQQTANPDTLRIWLQREEGKRDSMYQRVLSPAKYQLYLQKKGRLVSAN